MEKNFVIGEAMITAILKMPEAEAGKLIKSMIKRSQESESENPEGERPIEPREIDSYISGAAALYCVSGDGYVEIGYFSEKLGCYIAVVAYGELYTVTTWSQEGAERRGFGA